MYEIKFKGSDKKNHYYVLEMASSVTDAVKIAKAYLCNEIEELYSVALSQYKEAYHASEQVSDLRWYSVTMEQSTIDEKDGEKTVKYKILVEARDFDACYSTVKTIEREGYEMAKSAISAVKVEYVLQDTVKEQPMFEPRVEIVYDSFKEGDDANA